MRARKLPRKTCGPLGIGRFLSLLKSMINIAVAGGDWIQIDMNGKQAVPGPQESWFQSFSFWDFAILANERCSSWTVPPFGFIQWWLLLLSTASIQWGMQCTIRSYLQMHQVQQLITKLMESETSADLRFLFNVSVLLVHRLCHLAAFPRWHQRCNIANLSIQVA